MVIAIGQTNVFAEKAIQALVAIIIHALLSIIVIPLYAVVMEIAHIQMYAAAQVAMVERSVM